NVIITPDGYAKVLDFGLAKLRETSGEDAPTALMTRPGVAMGTLPYMAPEQFSGGEVTPATDIYALGVMLHEMLAGRRPGDAGLPAGVPPKLAALIARSLAKDPLERYRNGNEVHDALREMSRSAILVAQPATARNRKPAMAVIVALIVIAIIGLGAAMLVRHRKKTDAQEKIAAAEKLVGERKLADAFDMAMLAAAVIPDDPRIADIVAKTSETARFESDPPNATVYVEPIGTAAPQRVRLGVTPLTVPRMKRSEYSLTVEKRGFATVTRPVSFMPLYSRFGDLVPRPTGTIRVKLGEEGKVPAGMVVVEGGPYRLSGYQRPSDRLVELRDYLIDRYEVSNRQFEEFIRAGGYRRRELWKHPFVDGGKRLSFDEAIARFRDATGLPGPRGWSGGVPPAGRESHPVTDVTWYEAAAFAEWKGRQLPTVHQWERAARPPLLSSVGQSFPWGFVGEGEDVTERANFLAKGTMPVDSIPSGASLSGAHHLAGNVSEWCRNSNPPGYAARGGAWSDNVYSFGLTAALPAFYSAPTLGFRCVIGGGGDEGDFELSARGFVPEYKPVDDATFAEYRRRYDYARTPLNEKTVEITETADWIREKVTYEVAGKTVPAYLYLPKGFKRPLQVIHFAPAGDVVGGNRTLSKSIEAQHAPLIRTGRAFFAVELEGFLGRPRPPGWQRPDIDSAEYVDLNVERVTEMRRGLDYLATRKDIDSTRIALLGISAGGGTGVFATALDDRYRSVMFVGTGIATRETRFAAAANRINFVPRIRAPKLLLHGRYDEDTSLTSETEPMFKLLSEPKRLEVYEGIHAPPASVLIPTVTKWFDETMGPVEP
ncbi:MAG: SUMF1/EgtB/PvdO family nonheme iron enzyme, partial [Thermoanaerobaculia bacterium]